MHDGVAEVLRDRQYLDSSFSSGLLWSILLHGALVAAFFASSRYEAPPPDRPVKVRLAGQTSQSSPVQKPSPPAQSVAEPVKPVQTPQPTPATPPRVDPQPETKQVEKSLFGESPEKPVDRRAEDRERAAPSKKPPQEAIPATPQTPPASGASGAASPATQSAPGISVGAGTASISGLEGGDFPYTFYVQRMLGIIGGNWFRPDMGSGPAVTIHFVIQRNGVVRDVSITQSSGNATFDRAARRAVMESSPLPPLPLQYTGTELGVHLKFN